MWATCASVAGRDGPAPPSGTVCKFIKNKIGKLNKHRLRFELSNFEKMLCDQFSNVNEKCTLVTERHLSRAVTNFLRFV